MCRGLRLGKGHRRPAARSGFTASSLPPPCPVHCSRLEPLQAKRAQGRQEPTCLSDPTKTKSVPGGGCARAGPRHRAQKDAACAGPSSKIGDGAPTPRSKACTERGLRHLLRARVLSSCGAAFCHVNHPRAPCFHSRLSDALSSYRSHQKGGTLEKRCPRAGRWGGRSDPVWGRRRCSGGAWQCEADVAA